MAMARCGYRLRPLPDIRVLRPTRHRRVDVWRSTGIQNLLAVVSCGAAHGNAQPRRALTQSQRVSTPRRWHSWLHPCRQRLLHVTRM